MYIDLIKRIEQVVSSFLDYQRTSVLFEHSNIGTFLYCSPTGEHTADQLFKYYTVITTVVPICSVLIC